MCTENWSVRSLGRWIIESKVYLSVIHARTKKKVQDCDYVFEKNEWICESRYMFVYMYFAGFYLPFCDYSLCLVCILPQPAFYSQSAVCILHSVCILPMVRSLQSAVLQSAFYTDRSKSLLSSLQQLKESLDQKLNLKIPLLNC